MEVAGRDRLVGRAEDRAGRHDVEHGQPLDPVRDGRAPGDGRPARRGRGRRARSADGRAPPSPRPCRARCCACCRRHAPGRRPACRCRRSRADPGRRRGSARPARVPPGATSRGSADSRGAAGAAVPSRRCARGSWSRWSRRRGSRSLRTSPSPLLKSAASARSPAHCCNAKSTLPHGSGDAHLQVNAGGPAVVGSRPELIAFFEGVPEMASHVITHRADIQAGRAQSAASRGLAELFARLNLWLERAAPLPYHGREAQRAAGRGPGRYRRAARRDREHRHAPRASGRAGR